MPHVSPFGGRYVEHVPADRIAIVIRPPNRPDSLRPAFGLPVATECGNPTEDTVLAPSSRRGRRTRDPCPRADIGRRPGR